MIERIETLLHEKNYAGLKRILEATNCADLVTYLEELKDEELIVVFRLLPKEQAVEAFSYMEHDMQERLIHSMTDKELKEVTENLFLDDTVDLIEEMPATVVKRILASADAGQRKLINEFLNYPPDSAGSLMTIEFVDLKSYMTVEEAFDRIRKVGVDKESINTCYVLNEHRKLIGVVSVRELLLSKKTEYIADIMETNLITVTTHEDKENVAQMFGKYDFNILPVVDNEYRLVGIITVDDAIDVIQEENTEDFEKMAALNPSEDSYFKTSVFKHAKNRIVWLLILMLSATFTGTIITRYEEAFAAIPLLVAFIPMLMDTGGNCGSQTSTLVIRGMVMDEIHLKDYLKVLFKEIRVASLVGLGLAFVNGLRIFIQYHSNPEHFELALVIGLAIFATVILAKMIGCTLPMLAKLLKFDPALMASPLITTIVDTCSILIYFNIAMRIMNL